LVLATRFFEGSGFFGAAVFFVTPVLVTAAFFAAFAGAAFLRGFRAAVVLETAGLLAVLFFAVVFFAAVLGAAFLVTDFFLTAAFFGPAVLRVALFGAVFFRARFGAAFFGAAFFAAEFFFAGEVFLDAEGFAGFLASFFTAFLDTVVAAFFAADVFTVGGHFFAGAAAFALGADFFLFAALRVGLAAVVPLFDFVTMVLSSARVRPFGRDSTCGAF